MKKSILKKIVAPVAAFALVLGFAFSAVTPVAYAASCDVSGGMDAAAGCAKGKDQPEELFADGGVFQKVTDILLFVIGAVSVVMLIIGGIRYTVSQGDQGAVTSAKNTILYAIIGLVVAILAYAAVHFVISSFVNQ